MNIMWINPKEQTPIAYKTGNWDGKQSDEVLAVRHNGELTLARVYEGTMDGSHFLEWYDSNDYSLPNGVMYWMKIPEWP